MNFFYFFIFLLLFRFNSDSIFITRLMDVLVVSVLLYPVFQGRVRFYTNSIYIFISVCFCMSISLAVGAGVRDNYAGASINTYFEFFRPVLYFLLLSYFISEYKLSNVRGLLNLFKLYILVQSLMMFLQKLFPVFFQGAGFSALYDMSKISINLGRVVGLSGNPNTLAMCLSLVFLFLISRLIFMRKYCDAFWLICINSFLIYLSTSRGVFGILLLIYACTLIFIFPKKYSISAIVFSIVLLPAMLSLAASNLYYNELIVNFIDLSFIEIPSVYNRVQNYQDMISLMEGGYLLSGGPLKNLVRVGDNIFIFIFFQWGILGVLVQIIPFFVVVISSYLSMKKIESAYAVFSGGVLLFACGFLYETFYNLIYMPLYILFVAVFIKEKRQWKSFM